MQNGDFPHLTETLIESKNVFTGDFLKVVNDTITLPDGQLATREWIKFGSASAIIALTANNEIVLERQYRHPVGQVMIEIPAGKTELHETSLDGAKRELLEETGYLANSWHKLGACLPSIGYSNEKITYFLAEDLTLDKQNLDQGEFLDVFTMSIDKFFNLIYTNVITDSKTIAGAMLYLGYKSPQNI